MPLHVLKPHDMSDRSRFAGLRVLVVGLGRVSGVAAVQVLSRLGAAVVANDVRPEVELGTELQLLSDDPATRGVRGVYGSHPLELVENTQLVVMSPGVPYDLPMLRAARDAGIPTIGELELAYRLTSAPFVAITGTKGKSTTTTLIGHALSDGLSSQVRVAGNIGIALCAEAMESRADDTIVAEVSSFQLESIETFRPSVAVVLNISADHLDRHASMGEYVAAKARITENQRPDDLIVANADDPVAMRIAASSAGRRIAFGVKHGEPTCATLDGHLLIWREGGTETVVASVADIGVPGKHNVLNALATIATTMPLGVDSEAVRGVLRRFRGIPHAYALVGEIHGVRYINDSKATNIAAVRAAFDATDCENGRIVAIMGGVDKGNDYGLLLQPVKDRARHLVLLGKDTSRLAESFSGVVPLSTASTMHEAVQIASRVALAGDTVLMSPGHASFDLFANWKERGDAFEQAVRELG
ncbi:UDP-N-acetylmuramoyl-L-alanine--D-glutamate ligase [Candidatus Poribacteria bacterium]|nr:UDP-N-acetylmuramoyl-L-alanine--D-glutamate ligase [Candidatus Poribacteria bacterium]